MSGPLSHDDEAEDQLWLVRHGETQFTAQRRYSGRRQAALCQTQFSSSAMLSASRSSTLSHAGSRLRYSSIVVRRQTPRGFFASCQKL